MRPTRAEEKKGKEEKRVNISKSVHKTKEQTYQLEQVESMVLRVMRCSRDVGPAMVRKSCEMRDEGERVRRGELKR